MAAAYGTEAEMGRLALELALWQTHDDLFDWDSYPVVEHRDEAAESIVYNNGHETPARTTKAWEYQLNNGKTFYVVNGAAVAGKNPNTPALRSL